MAKQSENLMLKTSFLFICISLQTIHSMNLSPTKAYQHEDHKSQEEFMGTDPYFNLIEDNIKYKNPYINMDERYPILGVVGATKKSTELLGNILDLISNAQGYNKKFSAITILRKTAKYLIFNFPSDLRIKRIEFFYDTFPKHLYLNNQDSRLKNLEGKKYIIGIFSRYLLQDHPSEINKSHYYFYQDLIEFIKHKQESIKKRKLETTPEIERDENPQRKQRRKAPVF